MTRCLVDSSSPSLVALSWSSDDNFFVFVIVTDSLSNLMSNKNSGISYQIVFWGNSLSFLDENFSNYFANILKQNFGSFRLKCSFTLDSKHDENVICEIQRKFIKILVVPAKLVLPSSMLWNLRLVLKKSSFCNLLHNSSSRNKLQNDGFLQHES